MNFIYLDSTEFHRETTKHLYNRSIKKLILYLKLPNTFTDQDLETHILKDSQPWDIFADIFVNAIAVDSHFKIEIAQYVPITNKDDNDNNDFLFDLS